MGRIILPRALETSDLALRTYCLNHPAISSQLPIDTPLALADSEQWFRTHRLDRSRRDFAFDLHSGGGKETVAFAGLTAFESMHRRAELYIFAAPDAQGRGIGSAVLRWLVNFGFLHLNLLRIYLFTIDQNPRARVFYERHGFQPEGVMRQHTFYLGAQRDRYIHGILRSDWAQLSWSQRPPLPFEIELA